MRSRSDESVLVAIIAGTEPVSYTHLYIAYDKNTKYPYLDFQGRAWIFSEKEFADKAEEYFNKEETFLQMKELINLNVMNEFGKLHYLGIEKVIIDNGQYNIEINRNDILPPPDYSNIPARKIPVMNPKLQFAMIYFFQYAYSGKNYKNKAEVIRDVYKRQIASEASNFCWSTVI